MNRDTSRSYSEKALNLSTMVRKNPEIYASQMVENILKLSAMVGGNSEMYTSEMTEKKLNFPP